jgi:hypothetical protein
MSEVKDRFYEILVPKIEAIGFQYKKSKSAFLRVENELEYQIKFHWDGRGGTSILSSLWLTVNNSLVQKAEKILTGSGNLDAYFTGFGYSATHTVEIPVMYSRKTLDLANSMNFKELAKLTFDEKYPKDRILASTNFVEDLIKTQVLPFFEGCKTDADIYKSLCEQLKKEQNIDWVSHNFVLLIKLYAKKTGLPEPPELQNYLRFQERFKESFGDMNKVDFDTLEDRIKAYSF